MGRAWAATRHPSRVLLPATGALLLLATASLYVGSGDISAGDVTDILSRFVGGQLPPAARLDSDAFLVIERRVPRTVLALLVGASLGVAGMIVQSTTRNALADPGLLGVGAGAYTAIVLTSAGLGVVIGTTHVWMAMLGALVTTALVYVVGTSGGAGANQTKLVLSGVAIGAVLQGVSLAMTLALPEVFDRVRFWSAGSLQGRTFDDLAAVWPFVAAGMAIALIVPRSLNVLSLGDDNAHALGSRPALTRMLGLAAVTLLCGAATAAAGPIMFVGLIVAHAVRMTIGPDHRWMLALSAVCAAALVIVADIAGRVVVESELPVGVVTAFFGAPILVAIARRQRVRTL